MFLIILFLAIVIIPYFIPKRIIKKVNENENLEIACGLMWFFSLLILIGLIIAVIIINCNATKDKQLLEMEYKTLSLVIAENRLDGETAKQIVQYNYKITMAKEGKDSLWVGWFYPDIIAELPLIDIN